MIRKFYSDESGFVVGFSVDDKKSIDLNFSFKDFAHLPQIYNVSTMDMVPVTHDNAKMVDIIKVDGRTYTPHDIREMLFQLREIGKPYIKTVTPLD